MAAGMAIFRSDFMKIFTVKIPKWQSGWRFFYQVWWKFVQYNLKYANGNYAFSIEFDEKIRWNPKMPHETVLCDEFFYCENPKMAAGMALFRSDFMKFFTVKIQKWQSGWPFFDRIWLNFYGEIQKCQPQGRFFDRVWWNFYGIIPKMPTGMVGFQSDLMKKIAETQKYHTKRSFVDRIWWNLLLWKSKNGSRNGPLSIGFDEIFYGENPKMAVGMALFRSDLIEFLRWNPKMLWEMALFRSGLMKKTNWWTSKNSSRNGPFRLDLMKSFTVKIHKWQPGMIFFRSDLMKISLRWRSKNSSRDGPISIGFYGIFYGEIQKWQSQGRFYDWIWWKISVKSKNANGNDPFRSDLMKFFTVKIQKWQPEWSFFDRIWWTKFNVILKWQPELSFFYRIWWIFLRWKSRNGSQDGPFSIGFDGIFTEKSKNASRRALFRSVLMEFFTV